MFLKNTLIFSNKNFRKFYMHVAWKYDIDDFLGISGLVRQKNSLIDTGGFIISLL